MRVCLARMSAALACAAVLLGTLPALAKPADSQDNSFLGKVSRLASAVKTQGEKAIEAGSAVAGRALHDGRDVLADAQADAATRLEKFRHALNDQKVRLGMVAEDAAARLWAWQQETMTAWLDQLPDSWAETMREMHRSAAEMLDRLHGWLDRQIAAEEPAEISI